MDNLNEMKSVMGGIGWPVDRAPQQRGNLELPAGTVIVSADNHWSVGDDIFYKRFPAYLKDRAPRVWTDGSGAVNWEFGGKPMLPPHFQQVLATFERMPGCIAIEPRLRDLDKEGIQKEIVFGNAITALIAYPDVEVREWVYRIYNEHLAEMAALAPGRFFGVGMINCWDMSKVRESIAEVKALGLKSYLLPQFPKGEAGVSLNYSVPEMAPLWEAAEEAGLPICFHVGEVFHDGPGGLATTAMVNHSPFRKNLGELIFGGIFDRHPSLQVVFAEADLNWIPGALQTATMICEGYGSLLQPKIKLSPREYWNRNCYATFMLDPAGMSMLEMIGADRVMWTSDYPHIESTYGYSWSAIKAVIDAVPPHDARMILGGTATKVFRLQ
jgi:predicted TIM-barrel fold metal-dependent hydrolase